MSDDGTLGASRVFYNAQEYVGKRPGSPDGMEVSADGHLFATCPGGVHIISPQGKLLGILSTGERTANCVWGDDGSTLYMTADMYICRIRTKAQGLRFKAK